MTKKYTLQELRKIIKLFVEEKNIEYIANKLNRSTCSIKNKLIDNFSVGTVMRCKNQKVNGSEK